MALPVTIPNEFANATASIPLSQLDTNFTTLANAVNGISDGSETLANASVTVLTAGTANVTTLNTSGQVVFNDAGADVDFRVEGNTDANLLFVDASTDRVGIGTNSPTTNLNIASTGVPNLRFNHTDAGTTDKLGGVQFGGGADVSVAEVAGYYDGATDNGALVFSTEPTGGDLTERMRIDSSGNVMVGKTVASSATNGVQMGQAGSLFVTRDDNRPVIVRRNTSDGDLVEFFKDDTTVGSIGTSGGELYIDFGGSTGGAVTSRTLDDYEEGTWTPVLADASSGGNASPTSATNANYTKIGNLVNVQCQFTNIDTTGMTGASTIFIRNFPFSALSVSGTLLLPGSIILQVVTFSGYAVPYIIDNNTYGAFRQVSSGLTSSALTVGDFSSGVADLWMSLTYQAA